MKRFAPVVAAIVGLLVGAGGTHTYHLRISSQEAATQRVVAALGNVATAQVTLSLLKQQRTDALVGLCMRNVTENLAVADEGLSAGASLADQPIPSLTEALRRATVALRDAGAAPEVIARAESVLRRLPSSDGLQP